ncbi:MAG: TolC family protein [Bacteroidetes bacterium]|nr:TolC family protein [Bacteroidota bacterium]
MNRIKTGVASYIFLFLSLMVSGQNTAPASPPNPDDSLNLKQIMETVLTSYPSVLKAQQAIQAADAAIGLARSGYLPDIAGLANYTRLGPVSELSIPNMGTFQIFPENNYNAQVDVRQTIYDFSITSHKIKVEESGKMMAEKNVDLVKQRLSLITAISYYSLVYLQEALKVKDVQLANLNDHLAFVTKKKETGSATQYEILTTQVRISTAENQKVDILTSIKTQKAILNTLLGFPVGTELKVASRLVIPGSDVNPDSLIVFALQHRAEMALAGLKEDHAGLRLQAVRVKNNPVLGAYLSGGVKNGYIPDMNQPTLNYAAGVGLRVPIFDATRKRNEIKLIHSEINQTKQETEQTKREISVEVYQNEAALLASLQKIKQSDLQVRQAEEALQLAKVSFESGVITNLDLLDAETSEAESKVNLIKANADYAVSQARLNISLGRPVR